MGGATGIGFIDEINPLHDEGGVGGTITKIGNDINSFGSHMGNDINRSLDENKDFYTAAAIIASGAYLLGPAGAGWWGTSNAVAAPGAAGVSMAAPATAGELGLSSTGYLTGTGAVAPTTGYLGVSSGAGFAGELAGTGYLGVETASVAAAAESTPWWMTAGKAVGETALDVGKTALLSKLVGGKNAPTVGPVGRAPSEGGGFSQFVPGRETVAGGPGGIAKAGMGGLVAVAGLGLLAYLVVKRFSK